MILYRRPFFKKREKEWKERAQKYAYVLHEAFPKVTLEW